MTAWFSPFEHRLLEYLLFLPEFADEESFPRKCKQVLSVRLFDFPPFEYGLPLSVKNGNITDINEIFDLYNFIALNELIECNNDKLNVCN